MESQKVKEYKSKETVTTQGKLFHFFTLLPLYFLLL